MLIKRAFADKVSKFIDNLIELDESTKKNGVPFIPMSSFESFIAFSQKIGGSCQEMQVENNAMKIAIFNKYYEDGGVEQDGKKTLTVENQKKADEDYTDFMNNDSKLCDDESYDIKVSNVDLVPMSLYFECKVLFNGKVNFI